MANLIGTAPNQVPTNADLGSAAYINTEQLPVSDPQQSALDTKAPLASPTFTGSVTMPGTGVWNSSGNVGIGTTSPASVLEVAANSAILSLTDNNSAQNTSISKINFNYNTGNIGSIGYNGDSNLSIVNSHATGNILLTTNGNLGVGTSSPGTKLDVNGAARANAFGMNATGGTVSTGIAAPASDTLGFYTNTVERARIDASGNLGLGVTPSAYWGSIKALEIGSPGCGFTSRQNNELNIMANAAYGTYAVTGKPAMMYTLTNSGQYHWYTAPSGTAGNPITWTQAMTLDASGNLGVGTSSPVSKLDVTTSGQAQQLRLVSTGNVVFRTRWVDATAGMALESTNSTETAYYPLTLTGSTLRIGTGDGSIRATFDSYGNLGIGTSSPNANLIVNSSYNTWVSNSSTVGCHIGIGPGGATNPVFGVRFTATNAGIAGAAFSTQLVNDTVNSNAFEIYTNGATPLVFGTNSTERMRLDASGNLGIGTTSPSQKLHVAGTGYASSDFRTPIFYDSDNTSYYLDPASYSRIHQLTVTNARVDSSKYPVGHYTPGQEVFAIDPTWTVDQLREYFGSNSVSWVADSTAPGGYAISIAGAVNVGNNSYSSGFPWIPVETDDTFYMECYIKDVSGTNSHYMGSIDFNESFGNLGGNPGSYGYWVMSNNGPGTSWTKYSGYISGFGTSTGQFKSGTKYWTPQALFNYSGGGTSYISGWRVYRLAKGIVGRFPNSTTNSGEAWYGRANDRNRGSFTIQLGGGSSSGRVFEVVDYAWSSQMFSVDSGNYASAAGSFRAPIFYDSNNTSYYVDPASTSNFAGLTVANTITGSVSGSSASCTGNAATVSSIGATQVTNLYSPNGTTVLTNADSAMPSTGSSLIHTLSYGPSSNDGHILGMSWTGTTVYGAQLWIDTDPTRSMAFRQRSSAGVWNSWNYLLHDGNYNSYSPTLTGTGASGTWGINITGSSSSCTGNAATATNATNADTLDGHHVYEMSWGHDYTHGSWTDFNTFINTAYFGAHFVQSATNGPGHSGVSQYYHQRMSLGSNYNNYSLQLAIPRNVSDAYLYYRSEEGGSAGNWYKMRAGYADSAGSATNADTLDGQHASAFQATLVSGTNIKTVGGASILGSGDLSVGGFPAGTVMLFVQTTAPTGWTKSTTHDNKALRVVSGTAGSGGSTAFTSVFASRTPAGSVGISGGSVSISGGSVNETTLSNNQLAAHYHVGGLSAYTSWGRYGRSNTGINDSISDWYSGYTSSSGYNTSTIGSSSSHTHSFTQPNASYTNPSGSFSGSPMDFDIQYVDVIIATKN